MRTYHRPIQVALRLVLLAALAATAAALPASAGISGAGATGIQLLNLGATATDFELRFQAQGGGAVVSVLRSGVDPGTASNYYLPIESRLNRGAYAVEIAGAPEVVPLSRTDWGASGGAVLVEGSQRGTVLSVPLATNDGTFGTLVNIQNTDASAPAAVSIAAVRAGTSAVAASLDLTIAPSASATVDLGRHSGLATLGSFSGALVLTADRPIAASAIIDGISARFGVAGYAAQPADAAASTLLLPYVPIAAADASGLIWTATLALHNPSTAATDVEVTFTGTGTGACAADTGSLSVRLDGGAAAQLDLSPSASHIGAGCVAVAKVQSTSGAALTGALLARADNASDALSMLAVYAALPASDARPVLHAVLMRREHTSARFSTTFRLQNPGTAPATVTVEVRDVSHQVLACPTDCSLTVPPGGAAVAADFGGAMPVNAYGSAVLRSDVPLVGVFVDASLAGVFDAVSGPLLSTADIGRPYLPLVLNGFGGSSPPTRAATPGSGTVPPPPPANTPPPVPTSGPAAWPPPTAGDTASDGAASGILIFNRSTARKDVVVRFAPSTGEIRTVERGELEPGASANVYLPVHPELTNGSFVATLQDAAGFAAVARTDWFLSGSAVHVVSAPADDDIALPLVLRPSERAFVRIANPDPVSTASGTIRFDGASTSLSIAPGRFVAVAAPEAVAVARVAFDRPVVASALVFDLQNAKAVYAVAGRGTDDASTERWIPRAYRAAPLADAIGVTRSSRIVVANPSTAAIDVTAHLHGQTSACAGGSPSIGPRSIAAGGAVVIDLAIESAVPTGCAGPVRLEGTGAFVANSIDVYLADGAPAAAGAVPAVAASEAGTDLWLPILRLNHTTGARLTTDVSVVNPDDVPHTVTFAAQDSQGLPVGVTGGVVVLPPGGGHVFRGAEALGALNNSYGSGHVLSDGPVIARLDDFSALGKIDTSSSLAAPADAGRVGTLGDGIHLWAERNGQISRSANPAPTPAPTAVPSPPLTILAAAFVDVAGGTAVGCASCDGVYDAADRAAAAGSPLPRLMFTVRDAAGRQVGSGRSQLIDGIQVAGLQFPQAAAEGSLTVTFDGLPAGWSYCPNAPLERSLTIKDFELGTARVQYHFSNACVPAGTLPPIVPAALPDLPPGFGRSLVFLPWGSRFHRFGR